MGFPNFYSILQPKITADLDSTSLEAGNELEFSASAETSDIILLLV